MSTIELQAQKVGVGANSSVKKLSVNGSLMIDLDKNNTGSLDSAALVFGHPATVGISSNRLPGASKDGLDFWTGTTRRLSINGLGNMGAGIDPENAYKQQVEALMIIPGCGYTMETVVLVKM